MYNFEVRAKL